MGENAEHYRRQRSLEERGGVKRFGKIRDEGKESVA